MLLNSMAGTAEKTSVTLPQNRWLRLLIRDRYLYLMLVPIVAYFIIFKYAPFYGITLAFKSYRLSDTIWSAPWVGLDNFKRAFSSPDFFSILKNTLLLNLYSLVCGFPAPIILAILMNEIGSKSYKKLVQSTMYIPHFMSWIVLSGIVISVLSPSTGIVNMILTKGLGLKSIYFMADTFWWTVSYIGSGIWHNAGWGTIIYMAAITGIDSELYESARMDGANKFRQIWHITLPGIRSTIVILLILRMGNLMDIGFEQIYSLQNDAVRRATDVISTYEFRLGIQNFQYSYITAIGLFQSIVNTIMILGANKLAKKFGEEGLW